MRIEGIPIHERPQRSICYHPSSEFQEPRHQPERLEAAVRHQVLPCQQLELIIREKILSSYFPGIHDLGSKAAEERKRMGASCG